MNSIYLRRRRKVYFSDRDAAQHLPINVIATLQTNIESLGFALSPALAQRLQTLSRERLATFSKQFVKDLREMVGAHRVYEPLYPNFPDEVMEMSEAELYWNALMHYLTHEKPHCVKVPRKAFEEPVDLRVIDLGTKEDFETIATQLAAAKGSLSTQDKADLSWFIQQYGEGIARLLPGEIPFKENLAVVGAALLQHAPNAATVLNSQVKTATDVLRLAVALSDGDVSLAKPTKFGKFRRAARKQLLTWLERTGDPTEDMLRWPERWKRLGERLHPGDYAEVFPRTYAAFKTLREDLDAATFNGRVERGLLARNVAEVTALLAQRPGDFARRVDHLVRVAADPAAVTTAFAAVVDRVSTPVALQVMTHFRHRGEARSMRVVFPKGDVGKAHAITTPLPPLPAAVTEPLAACCRASLIRRFAVKPSLGTCWIDPALANFPVPFAQRSASKALRSLPRGSRLPLPAGDCIRFFLWWKNGTSRTDLDLSAALYNGDGKYVDVVSCYNLKNFGGHHSGDIVDAPNGAAEFIDLDIPRTLAMGVRYVIMSVNSFTAQPYCDLPECFAGWMSRKHPGSGEIFEARTVQDKVDLSADTRICLPAIMDLQQREVIWTDLALTKQPLWNNVENNRPGMGLMLQAMLNLVKPDLQTLFALHVEARGQRVDLPDGAETVFGVHTGVTPFDGVKILAEFL